MKGQQIKLYFNKSLKKLQGNSFWESTWWDTWYWGSRPYTCSALVGRNRKLNPAAISSKCYLRWLLYPDHRAKNVPGIREAESNPSMTTRWISCIHVNCGEEIWLWKPRRLARWPGSESDSSVWLASSTSAVHQILALRSNKARGYFSHFTST